MLGRRGMLCRLIDRFPWIIWDGKIYNCIDGARDDF